MTNPTPHGQVPAIQRYKIGYHTDEWGVRSSTPGGITDPSGQWVLYKDHLAALASHGQTPARADMQDAYVGAREDLAIWKRRALEAERDLRAERETASRLAAEINAINGPTHLGEPAPTAQPAPPPTPQADIQPAPARDERDDFEKVFPRPSGCIRCGTGYASTGYSNWAAHTHVDRWKGWHARAARAPADSVTAPVGGETYHLGACIVEDMLHATVMRKEPGRAGAVTVLLSEQIPVEHLQDRDVIVNATPPAQAADSVLEDAARYRWLRATTNYVTSNGERIDVRNTPEKWDAAIDAARAAQEDKSHGRDA